MSRIGLAIGFGTLACALVLVGAIQQWFGPLVVCGVDQAPLCVAWSGVAGAATLLACLSLCAALATGQVRDWLGHSAWPGADSD